MKRTLLAVLALALLSGFSTPAAAADAVVLRAVTIETSDVGTYVKEIDKARAMMKRLESPSVTRVFQARFAGPNAGVVVVAQEWPSMAAFAKDVAKVDADAEYQAWLKGLSKIRKVLSDSLYTELKP
ncbi:MAG: hypothetical protein WCC53_17535 [Thermoanaerobaculia bacterium]